MLFKELAQEWLQQLDKRLALNKIKPASVASFRQRARHAIDGLGELSVEAVRNGAVKQFAESLAANHGPKTVRENVLIVKMILQSHVDRDGEPLFDLSKWRNNFIFENIEDVKDQRRPTISAEALNAILRNCEIKIMHRVLLTLAAASGMRIGELLATKVKGDSASTTWDSKVGVIHVRQSLWNGELQKPKTDAAIRQIDLHDEVNALLASFIAETKKVSGAFLFSTRKGTPLDPAHVQKYITAPNGIPGMHSLRRYRATLAEENGCPRSLLAAWMGHSTEGEGITGRYIKSENKAFRKMWCQRIGTGLNIVAPIPVLDQAASEAFDEIFAPLSPAEAELEQMRAGAEALC